MTQNLQKPYVRVPQMTAGFATLVILGLLYGWSIFRAPLQEMFPSWSETAISSAFTALMCFFAIGSMSSGLLSKKFQRPVLCVLCAACMCIGFLGVSTINQDNPTGSLIKLYVFYCGFCGFATGLGYNFTNTNIVKWFPDREGLALGVCLMGYGLGALIMGGFARALFTSHGLPFTFRVLGIVAPIILLIIAPTTKEPDEQRLPKPQAKKGQETFMCNMNSSQMLRTPEFWSIMVWASLVSAGCLLVVNSAASVTQYYGAPIILGLIVSVTNGLARVLTGFINDNFGFKTMTSIHHIFIVGSGALMLIGSLLHSGLIITIGLIVTGLAFGFTPTTIAIFMKKRYGPKHFSMNYSFFSWQMLVSAILGSTFSGILLQTVNAENYFLPAFILMAVYCGLAVVSSIPFRRKVQF